MKNTPTIGASITLQEAFFVWLKIGLLSFGGPAGQIALMHRLLVEEKKWVSEERFLHALNYCMLLPGPEAQQLAIYLGWLLHKTRGGVIAGVLFVLPGALVILALSALYASYQQVPLVSALFYGIKATVLAVVMVAAMRIAHKILGNALMYYICASSFIALYFFAIPFPIVILSAACIGLLKQFFISEPVDLNHAKTTASANTALVDDILTRQNSSAYDHTRPSLRRSLKVIFYSLLLWLTPLVVLSLLLADGNVFLQEGVFFSKMAVVTFGGAYAVLAYVAQQAVEVFAWLKPGEMLDGLGLAETTPGPLIMVVQFVGFMGAFRNPGSLDPMLAGTLGALVTTWVTFVPCFFWILLGGPYIESLRNNKHLAAALSMITAAVLGVILNLSIWFSSHVLFSEQRAIDNLGLNFKLPVLASIDPIALAITLSAFIAMQYYKISMIKTLVIGTILGVLVH